MEEELLHKKENKKLLFGNKGSSYIEFIVVFLFSILVFYVAIQMYSLINAQILVLNTARSALREVEVYGRVPSGLVQEVTNSLSSLNRIDPNTISIKINDNEIYGGEMYQLRQSIKLKLTADYSVFFFSGVNLLPSTSITLSASYAGTSQKLNKDMGSYTPVEDN